MIKLFAHRGFVADLHPQNSIASLKEAVLQGFSAVEFDIWFFTEKLFLKHDQPVLNEVNILPELADYFYYKNDLTYWMDFKNLDAENCDLALFQVKNAIEAAQIKLDQIYFAPFITDLQKAEKIFAEIRNIFGSKAKIVAVCESFINDKAASELKKFLDQNNIKALSIFHQLLNKNSLEIFSGIEIFAWTVNDLERLKELESLGVKNFATDKITPQIYAQTNLSRTS